MSAHEYIGGERTDSLLALVGRTLPDTSVQPAPVVGRRYDDTSVHLLPTVHHARMQLVRVEQMLLAMWANRMPDLDDAATDRLCAAHRAVHEAMLLLDDERIIADTGELPIIR